MSVAQERLYVEAPYTQTRGAFERRLGIPAGSDRGTCILTLAFPVGEGHEIARVVTAKTQRLPNSANYTSHYAIAWDAGRTERGLPTPAFTGTLTLSAGENYSETELKLDGQYDPPGGAAGRAFDELVGRRIAHATLGALLAGVGEELREVHERIEAGKHESLIAHMTNIKIDIPVPDLQAVVAPRLLTVLSGYAARNDVVLTLDVGMAGAAMSVLVTVELGDSHTRTPTVIPIALRATQHTGLFPTFRGDVRSEAVGTLESILRLDGTYDTPLGMFGSIVDHTVLGHAAERSLGSFLERLRSDVIVEIQRAELAVRRHEGRHT